MHELCLGHIAVKTSELIFRKRKAEQEEVILMALPTAKNCFFFLQNLHFKLVDSPFKHLGACPHEGRGKKTLGQNKKKK